MESRNEESLKIFIKSLLECKSSNGSLDVNRVKLKLAKKLGLKHIPSNLELLKALIEEASQDVELKRLKSILKVKPVKTISGVSVITLVTPPSRCPHGRCIYCPGGLEYGTPQSYTGKEAAVQRAKECNYDPYLQAKTAIEKLELMGHDVDKIELIIIGGTFNAFSLDFQKNFIKGAVMAIAEVDGNNLEEVLEKAETARRRISGITIETRPDCINLESSNALLEMGVTRVELGVQSIDDDVLRICRRGHTVDDVVNATRLLKDLAFKVCYHLMPNLPGSSYEKDLEMFKRVFEDPDFRPDMIKIYPTLVLDGTELYNMWISGDYKPYTDEELINLLCEWFSMTPPYVRIIRVQREIPLWLASAGNKIHNLREVVERRLIEIGRPCRCIRCREVGHKSLKHKLKINPESIRLNKMKYEASGGVEYFISYEDLDADVLFGFLRLRIPSSTLRPELRSAALVRELHVYGKMVPVYYEPDLNSWQHRGFGSSLLNAAEEIALSEGCKKVVVISGIGVREYYYKHGYKREGPYVAKYLG